MIGPWGRLERSCVLGMIFPFLRQETCWSRFLGNLKSQLKLAPDCRQIVFLQPKCTSIVPKFDLMERAPKPIFVIIKTGRKQLLKNK